MEDAAIVDLYWQRSDLAISETDKKYGRYCHTIAYQICNDNEDAEECVNDTWFRAWNHPESGDQPDPFQKPGEARKWRVASCFGRTE